MILKFAVAVAFCVAIACGQACWAQALQGGVWQTESIPTPEPSPVDSSDFATTPAPVYRGGASDGRMQFGASAPPIFRGNAENGANMARGYLNGSNSYAEQDHGQRIVGVIGCYSNMMTGTIISVFPESNLNKWGIHFGDRIVGYNNHAWRNGWDLQREGCAGPPGSIIELTIAHDGQTVSLPVPRIDSRLVASYNSYFRKAAARSKFW